MSEADRVESCKECATTYVAIEVLVGAKLGSQLDATKKETHL